VDAILEVLYALLALAVVAGILGVINTLALSVLERTREIGLLRALGLTRRQLRSAVRIELALVAVLGGLLGLAGGYLLGAMFQRAALRTGLLDAAVPLGQVALALGALAAAGVLAASWPARRAARTDPLTALLAVLTGCPVVRFGLLPERFGMQLPRALGSLPSRLRKVTAAQALQRLGRLLVQVLGAAVCCKLTRLRLSSALPCSRQPVRLLHCRCSHAGVGCPAAGSRPGRNRRRFLAGALVDSQVLTVLEDTGGLLCRAEDRQHAGNLAVVAEGHTEHPRRRVGGQHGQRVEAAAALALRPDRATAGVVQVHHAAQLLSCRRHAAPSWLTAGSTGARRSLGC
jgi:FtsX-like permease family